MATPDDLQLGVPVQIAYAVDHLELEAEIFAEQFGAGPFFVRHHEPFDALHHGESGVFRHSAAYGQWGDVQVELVKFGECSPVSLHRTVVAGSGLHHVAMFVESLPAEQARLESLGMPCVMLSTTAGGMQFAFHDARASFGHFIEIYEPVDGAQRLYRRVREAAIGWDGSDPVRPM